MILPSGASPSKSIRHIIPQSRRLVDRFLFFVFHPVSDKISQDSPVFAAEHMPAFAIMNGTVLFCSKKTIYFCHGIPGNLRSERVTPLIVQSLQHDERSRCDHSPDEMRIKIKPVFLPMRARGLFISILSNRQRRPPA